MDVKVIKYGDICDRCAHGAYCDMATFGGHNPKITACFKFTERHQTHADRIRAMSDEELADWLYMWAGGAPNCDRDLSEHPDNKKCRDCWLDWLKQEAEESE